jgi:hypothetical protein
MKALPTDEEILDAWFHGKVNLCNPYVANRMKR